MQQCHFVGSLVTMLVGIILSAMLGPSLASTQLRSHSGQQQAPSPAVPPAYPVQQLAPPPAAGAVPKAGDLVGQVKDQLATDHRTLGKVSASLMSVQSSVDKTEQSMLGKVLDLQTARSFFTRHEEIDTANNKMEDENAKLNAQVEELSSTLSKAQKKYLSDAMKNRANEGNLHEQIVENKALIASMDAELAKSDDYKAELKKLTEIHKDLMAEATNLTEMGRQTEKWLHTTRGNNANEVRMHKSLRYQLIAMNNYSTKCYTSVAKASEKLGMLMVSDAKDSQAMSLTLKQKAKATDATQQRLLAEHALLVAEVKKAEREAFQGVARMKDFREDMDRLEHNILLEVNNTEAKIKEEKEHIKTLGIDLMQNAQAEMESVTQKEAMDLRIEKLIAEIRDTENPIIIATTEGQNQALHAELGEAMALWKEGKRSETAAILNVEQAAAGSRAEQETLKIAEKGLVFARKEARKRVEEAVEKAAKGKARAKLVIEKARAAIVMRCTPEWNEIWKPKRTRLMQCKTWKEEMSMEMAKKTVLETTLTAAQSAYDDSYY